MTDVTQLPSRRDLRSRTVTHRPITRRLLVVGAGLVVTTAVAGTIVYLGRSVGPQADALTVLDTVAGASSRNRSAAAAPSTPGTSSTSSTSSTAGAASSSAARWTPGQPAAARAGRRTSPVRTGATARAAAPTRGGNAASQYGSSQSSTTAPDISSAPGTTTTGAPGTTTTSAPGTTTTSAPATTTTTSAPATTTTTSAPATTSAPSTATTQSSSSSSATQTTTTKPPTFVNAAPGRRGFLYLIGHSPTAAEIDAMPSTYGVVVLNEWDSAMARRLKQRDPSVIVLMYQCLSSTRTADDPTHRSGGVLYRSADASWFATDTSGNRMPWTPYPGTWQMAVWDAGYQQSWVNTVVPDVVSNGWDGVLADNDMSTLSWYTNALLAGAGSRSATDAKIRDGVQHLIDQAGPALNAKGKLLVPNISDARLFAGRWAAQSRYGGGMEENFAHFGQSSTSDWVGDWGSDGWMAQTDQMGTSGLSLAVTRAAPGDHRTELYGYTSMLVRADGDAFWVPSTDSGGSSNYASRPSIPEMSWPLGAATGNPVRTSSGAWTRQYAGVWVAVNPNAGAVTLTPPAGARNADGSDPGTVRLEGYTGVLLRMS